MTNTSINNSKNMLKLWDGENQYPKFQIIITYEQHEKREVFDKEFLSPFIIVGR